MIIIEVGRTMRYVVFIAGALILISLAIPVTLTAQSKVDSTAPSFSLLDLQGNRFDLEQHLGSKLTIILFWATWGHDSIEMLDDIERLYLKYQNRGLEAVGVCVEQQSIVDSVKQRITDTVQHKKISFPVLLDDQLQTFRRYGVIAVPTSVVIDANRKILYHLSGYPIVGREELFGFIQERFEGKRKINNHKKFERDPDKKALRLYNMAEMKYAKGQLDTAKKYASEAAARDSGFIQPLLLLTEAAIEERDLKNAAIHAARALQLEPKSIPALSLSGLIAAKNGETEKAIKILESVIMQNDTFAIAHCYLGYALGLTGDGKRSDEEFSRAEDLSPAEYRIPISRSEIYERSGKQKEAMSEKIKAKRLRREK